MDPMSSVAMAALALRSKGLAKTAGLSASSRRQDVLQLKYRDEIQNIYMTTTPQGKEPLAANIEDVKDKAWSLWRFPDKDKIQIYFRGQQLEERLTCQDYGINYAMCLILKYENAETLKPVWVDESSTAERGLSQHPTGGRSIEPTPAKAGLTTIFKHYNPSQPGKDKTKNEIATSMASNYKEREDPVHDASAMWDTDSIGSVKSEREDADSLKKSNEIILSGLDLEIAIQRFAWSLVGGTAPLILEALKVQKVQKVQREPFIRNHVGLLASLYSDLRSEDTISSMAYAKQILHDVDTSRQLSEFIWALFVSPEEAIRVLLNLLEQLAFQDDPLRRELDTIIRGEAYTRYIRRRDAFLGQEISPLSLKNLATTGAFDGVENLLASDFDTVAQGEFAWLHELKEIGCQYHEMARVLVDGEALSPWIVIESPSILPMAPTGYPSTDLHQMYCVHHGGRATEVSPCVRSKTSLMLNTEIPFDEMRRMVNETCGIAGVLPFAGSTTQPHLPLDAIKLTGEKNSIAWISYNPNQNQDSQFVISNILAVLSQINSALHFLQDEGFCCNCITILRLEELSGAIELCQVSVSLILRFQAVFDMYSKNLSSLHNRRRCIDCVSEILCLTIGQYEACEYVSKCQLLDAESSGDSLHLSALAAQLLSIGVLCYSTAHVGKLHPDFLVDPLEEIHLLGTSRLDQRASHVVVELFDFTCMKDMLQESILAFRLYDDNPARFSKSLESRQRHNPRARYDLLASAEDLADTWGAARFIVDSLRPRTLMAIEIGGGTIMGVDQSSGKLHWSAGQGFTGLPQWGFQSDRKMVIAGSTINKECPLNEHKSWQDPMTHAYLQHLGTSNDSWVLREKQAGLQAGSYAVMQFNNTYIKQSGVTLKQRQLMLPLNEIDLAFLNSTCGLQVSFCTGVARRVALRELLADVMVPFVESRLSRPEQWEPLKTKHRIVENFWTGDLEVWFDRLSTFERDTAIQIVRSMLDVLKDTGIDRNGEELVIAWVRKDSPYSCLRIRCEKTSLWARILADSEDCATFACMTPLCLEIGKRKCRNLEVAPWHNVSTMLDTAVCQHLSNRDIQAVTSSQLVPWQLQHQVSYWIGKAGSNLIAKVWLTDEDTEPKLVIKQKVIPEKYRARLPKSVVDRLGRLRERQASEAIAKQVLVMTEI